MNRNLASVAIFLTVLASMFTIAFDVQSVKAEPKTWTVDDNGPADFSTIQEAINVAGDGDTIFVKTGTYYENVVVNRTVSLVGEDVSATVIDGNYTGHVVMITSDSTNMTGFTVQHSGIAYHITGINPNSVTHCNVSENILTNNEHGLEIHNYSYFNVISGNNMTNNNKWGMHVIDSHYNNVSGNMIRGSIWGSIAVHGYSTYNLIFGNSIGDNDEGGISVDGSDYNEVYENNITSNLWGISIQYGSKCNTISRNYIADNNYSIKLESSTLDNMFCHNNLVNNAFRVSLAGYNYANSWDDGYPSGGNYWSDFNGTDFSSGFNQNETGSNGIGDAACVIDANNIDRYPLKGMFFDHEATSECHVQTICNSTLSDFQFNGTAIGFSVSGESGTAGFCRVCIPTALMNDTYCVFVSGTEVLCNLLACSNATHIYLCFNYSHSVQEVIIIPEFSFLIPLLLMLATLVAVMVSSRKP